MAEHGELAGYTVASLLDAIASTEPAPGCGAAAGVVLGLGIACARKAVRISLRHDGHPELALADNELAQLASHGILLGDEDAAEMEALIGAVRARADTTGTAEERDSAVDRSRVALLGTSNALVAACDEASRLLERITPLLRANVAGDGRAALALIAAARSIANDNAEEAEEGLGS